ncbi:hypothetical protein GS682_18495 [Nostoc sp. B(2019)]|nr:hypothetical protein [Nostoc sp. B(2019)]
MVRTYALSLDVVIGSSLVNKACYHPAELGGKTQELMQQSQYAVLK